MPWKKLKVDRGWPAMWRRCGKDDNNHDYCVFMAKFGPNDFRWGWTQGPNRDVDDWAKPVGGQARRAKEQAEDHLKYLVGRGGRLLGVKRRKLTGGQPVRGRGRRRQRSR